MSIFFHEGGFRGAELSTGALVAAFGGGAAAFPQGFTAGLGQIPAGAAIPGLLAGGIALAAAPAYVAGVALTLIPDGLTPIAAFPPFEKPEQWKLLRSLFWKIIKSNLDIFNIEEN